jgi:flagellar basal body-associated protein FliL
LGGKGSFFILLIIVAVLTLALAVLAGYLFFVAGSPNAVTEVSAKETTVRPSDENLGVYKLYESKEYFNLKNEDESKIAVIRVNVQLVYYKKVKGIKDVAKKIETYDGQLKEIVGTYFQSLTLEEVKKPETKEKAKTDLAKRMNELLTASEKEKRDIIYTINFDDWFYQ